MELKKVLLLPPYLMKVNKQWKKLQAIERLYLEKKWLQSISLANEMVISMEDDFYGYYVTNEYSFIFIAMFKAKLYTFKVTNGNHCSRSFKYF